MKARRLIEEDGKYHLIVKIELRYELDSKYVDDYKSSDELFECVCDYLILQGFEYNEKQKDS